MIHCKEICDLQIFQRISKQLQPTAPRRPYLLLDPTTLRTLWHQMLYIEALTFYGTICSCQKESDKM